MTRSSKLHTLNIVQTLAALNETLFRFLVAFYLIGLQKTLYSSDILAITGAVFIVPFLLFSTLGGLLADRFDKTRIIKITRVVELGLLVACFLAFALESGTVALLILFLMASTSAIFSPSKYGIIPEIYYKNRLLKALSLISAFTYIGVIIGTAATSLLLELTNSHYMLVLLIAAIIALIGLLYALRLSPLPAMNPRKKIPIFFYKEFFISLIEMKPLGKLYATTIAYGYFLFIGAFVQLNIIPFAMQTLSLRSIDGGYLFLITALGIGIGSFFAAKVSQDRMRLKLIPWTGYAISFFTILLGLFPKPIYLTITWLILLGFFGGLFIVYSGTYILNTSPNETRGKNFSTANFISFFFILVASFALYGLNTLLQLDPSTSFVIVGIINAIVMIGFSLAFKTSKPAKL